MNRGNSFKLSLKRGLYTVLGVLILTSVYNVDTITRVANEDTITRELNKSIGKECLTFSRDKGYVKRSESYWSDAFVSYCSNDVCMLYLTHLIDSVHHHSELPILVFIFKGVTVPLGWHSRFSNLIVFKVHECERTRLTYAQRAFLMAPVETGVLFEANTVISSGANAYFREIPARSRLFHPFQPTETITPLIWRMGKEQKRRAIQELERCASKALMVNVCFQDSHITTYKSVGASRSTVCDFGDGMLAHDRSVETQLSQMSKLFQKDSTGFRYCSGLKNPHVAAELVQSLKKELPFAHSN